MLIKYAAMVVCAVVLHLGLAKGIKLPGPCPKVSPTSREKGPLTQKLRASVRFSADNPSHVFNVSVSSWFLIGASADSPPEKLEIRYADYFISGTFEETIVEEVRLWQDGDMSLWWSCVNSSSKNGSEHDAALLVTNNGEVTKKTVLKVCRKFVSKEMVEHLQFDVPNDDETPFYCPGRQRIRYIFVGTLSILLIVGVSYGLYCLNCGDYNKVYAVSM